MTKCRNDEKYDKIIFLDIDGVINDKEYFECLKKEYTKMHGNWPNDRAMVNENKLNIFAELCENNDDLKICLSSSHRCFTYQETIDALSRYKEWKRILTFIVGSTPVRSYSKKLNQIRGYRGEEIKAWLEKPGRTVNQYCIVDDEYDFLDEQERFIVRPSEDLGVTDKELQEIKTMLDLK